MSDEISKGVDPTPNPYKEVHITVAGKDWKTAFGGSNSENFFAKDLKLYTDKGVELSVKSEYAPVLSDLMEKFRGTTVGKISSFIQKFSQASEAITAYESSTNKTDKDKLTKAAKESILKKIRILPPNVRYQTRTQSLPAWKDTGPLDVGSFKFHFYMGMADAWDARTEVYNPALALSKVNQPIELTSGQLRGPLPNVAWVYGTIGMTLGTSIQNTFSNAVEGKLGTGSITEEWKTYNFESSLSTLVGNFEDELEAQIKKWPGTGLVEISVGRFSLPRMSVESTSVSFSSDTDEYGFPIYADVTWSGCKTLEVATTGQIPLISGDEGLKSKIASYNTPLAAEEEAKLKKAREEYETEMKIARTEDLSERKL